MGILRNVSDPHYMLFTLLLDIESIRDPGVYLGFGIQDLKLWSFSRVSVAVWPLGLTTASLPCLAQPASDSQAGIFKKVISPRI